MRPIKNAQIVGSRTTAAKREGLWEEEAPDAPAGATEPRTETVVENHRQDAPGQRGQPGPGAGPGRGESEEDAGRPAPGRLGHLGGAGHDRAQAAPLVPDPPGRGPALRHRSPAPGAQGGGPGPRAWPPSTPRANCPTTTGNGSPWTTTIRSIWRIRATPPSPPANRLMETAAAPTTNTRPGPPRRGASRPPCGGWPCWSRSTAWPPT